MTKIVMVDTVSTFLIRYAVELEDTDPDEYALDTVVTEEHTDKFKEFSQRHLGYHVASHRVVSQEEYLRMFDEDNDYLKNLAVDKKLDFINDK